MKTFGALAMPGAFLGPGGQTFMGRLVANTEFMRALFRHGGFDDYCFFVGENGDRDALQHVFVEPGFVEPARLRTRNLLELPRALGAGELSVLHHSAHVDQFPDLVWLRDRHVPASAPAVPVTAQIHSLSYPRMMASYLRTAVHPPGPNDAIFCSSHAGRDAVQRSLAAARAALSRLGAQPPPMTCALPVVPLGIDVERLQGGERAATRARLGIPGDAVVVLGLGRFTEYDKMDLFPLLQVFARVLARRAPGQPPLRLLLAGARQGTRTPEMLGLWAQALGIGQAVVLHVDFPDDDKRHLLAAADLFVSPCDNLQETFGISVIEALAAGLPAIVSDFDGYKDTVTPDVGVRVPTRWNPDLAFVSDLAPLLYERPLHLLLGQSVEVDLSALEAALHELCADSARRDDMSRRAAARARALYDWRAVIPQYEAVWQTLAATPRAPLAPRPPVPDRHPLAMDFGEIFASFPTEALSPSRPLRPSALARTLCVDQNGYVVYPELRNVFTNEDVLAALSLASPSTTLAALTAALASRYPGEAWRITFLTTWLIKHGLLS